MGLTRRAELIAEIESRLDFKVDPKVNLAQVEEALVAVEIGEALVRALPPAPPASQKAKEAPAKKPAKKRGSK